MKEAAISLYHDTRRELDNANYPVKLRVYYNKKAKLYDTGMTMTVEDFERSYLAAKPRDNFKELKIKLQGIESSAREIIKDIRLFTFAKFERKFFKDKFGTNNVIDYYKVYRDILESEERIGTESSYACSINSIKSFINDGRKSPVTSISFEKLTSDFLTKYEKWMIANGKTKTTVGIYLRPLRKIFNDAIEAGDIDADTYPFKKYKIPTGKNTKKNLESKTLKDLFTAKLEEGSHVEKARDFWFFSYQCNGMNFRDIAELKFKDITSDYFSFIRHKTKNTTKDSPTPIIVPITDHIRAFFEKYAVRNGKAHEYVFPIFKEGMSAKERHRVNQNFIRFVNQHMQKLADSKGVLFKLGTMYARHSFTTKVTRELGLEFAQEALGHTTLVATQNYWAGFENKTKKEMADKLLDFD